MPNYADVLALCFLLVFGAPALAVVIAYVWQYF
jgi:hypothetical protein